MFRFRLALILLVVIGIAPASVLAQSATQKLQKAMTLYYAADNGQAFSLSKEAAEQARQDGDQQTYVTGLQIAAFAAAAADELDQAEQLAVVFDKYGEAGLPASANIRSAIAMSMCLFGKSADYQMRIQSVSRGDNDIPTECNLARIDLVDGRSTRAVERLMHAKGLPFSPKFSAEVRAEIMKNLVKTLVVAFAKAGRLSDAGRLATPEIVADLKRVAFNSANYSLKTNKAVYFAYYNLSSAILVNAALSATDADLAPLREQLNAVLKLYAAAPSKCANVIPAPLALESPGNREILVPTVAELDTDHDGIPDSRDKCPNQAEVINNIDDMDGCPDEAPGYWVGSEIRLNQQIPFDFNSDVIQPAAQPMLDWLAGFIQAHDEIQTVSLEGHTDDVGQAAYNFTLSQKRARAVMAALVSRGVAQARLASEGYGMTRPKFLGKDEASRAGNRRVEILTKSLVKVTNVPVPVEAQPTTN